MFEYIRSVSLLVAKYNIKMLPSKYILFTKKVRWGGRFKLSDGIRQDPRGLNGQLHMEPPTIGAHLKRFYWAIQWVKQAIRNFTELVALLHDFMQGVYGHMTKCAKHPLDHVLLDSHDWDKTELEFFKASEKALANQVMLAHRDPSQLFCVYTDASDLAWAGIITQMPLLEVTRLRRDHRKLTALILVWQVRQDAARDFRAGKRGLRGH